MHRKIVLIHVGMTSLLLGSLTLLFKFADTAHSKPLFHTVHVTALTVVSSCIYYILFELVRGIAPLAWGLARRGNGQTYSEVSDRPLIQSKREDCEDPNTPLEQQPDAGRARLTMGNIWGLVYGLGISFFVGLYCLSGEQPICTQFFSGGLLVLCIEDLQRPLGFAPYSSRNRILECLACLMAFTSVVMACFISLGVSGYVDVLNNTDPFSIFVGVIFPFAAPLVIGTLKNSPNIHVGDMIELCEFGMPFLFIIGVGFTAVTDAQRINLLGLFGTTQQYNTTVTSSVADSTNWINGVDFESIAVILATAPLFSIPILIFIATATLRNHAVDSLISIALVMVGILLVDKGISAFTDPLSICAIITAKLCLVMRLSSTAYVPGPQEPVQLSEENT